LQAELPHTLHSCSWHVVVTARLTLEWPGVLCLFWSICYASFWNG